MISPTEKAFLNRAEYAAKEAYLSIFEAGQHVRTIATPEQMRAYAELLRDYKEAALGVEAFVKSLEGNK